MKTKYEESASVTPSAIQETARPQGWAVLFGSHPKVSHRKFRAGLTTRENATTSRRIEASNASRFTPLKQIRATSNLTTRPFPRWSVTCFVSAVNLDDGGDYGPRAKGC